MLKVFKKHWLHGFKVTNIQKYSKIKGFISYRKIKLSVIYGDEVNYDNKSKKRII